jgi:hypothetical protein
MTISWFIPQGNQFIRVEEDLVNLSDFQLIFTQKGVNYRLQSTYNLKDLLIDDTIYAYQIGERLFPIQGSPVYNSESPTMKFADIEPEKLKEILEKSTSDLQKEIDRLKNLIQFELKKNAEEDIKKMNFLQEVDSYRDILYRRFLDFFKDKSVEIEKEKNNLSKNKAKNNTSTVSTSVKDQPTTNPTTNAPTPVTIVVPATNTPVDNGSTGTKPVNTPAAKIGAVNMKNNSKPKRILLISPEKKAAYQSMFKE